MDPIQRNAPDRRSSVRARYTKIARGGETPGSGGDERPGESRAGAAICCGTTCRGDEDGRSVSETVGYTVEELATLPPGADLGLGSGHPVRAAWLRPGETVLDLGSGAGIDAFLAARAVGPEGRVIGVDMTPAMLERARGNLDETDLENVEFRLGEVEALPVADGSVDVVISNCVLNLAADRPRALREAYRVLRPGGRVVISDLLSEGEPPAPLLERVQAETACLPVSRDRYAGELEGAGFVDVRVEPGTAYPRSELSTAPVADALAAQRPELAARLESFMEGIRGGIVRARKADPGLRGGV